MWAILNASGRLGSYLPFFEGVSPFCRETSRPLREIGLSPVALGGAIPSGDFFIGSGDGRR